MCAEDAAGGEVIDVWSFDGGGTGAAEVAVAHVIGKDDEELGSGMEGADQKQGEEE